MIRLLAEMINKEVNIVKLYSRLIVFFLCLILAVFTNAEEYSLLHPKETLGELTNRIERIEVENKLLSDSIKRQADKIDELVAGFNDVRRKLDSKSNDIKQLSSVAETHSRIGLVVFLIFLPIVLLLLFVGRYLFWPHHETGQVLASQPKSDLPKCPCCGWEHDPSETICRNPRCKTHF